MAGAKLRGRFSTGFQAIRWKSNARYRDCVGFPREPIFVPLWSLDLKKEGQDLRRAYRFTSPAEVSHPQFAIPSSRCLTDRVESELLWMVT